VTFSESIGSEILWPSQQDTFKYTLMKKLRSCYKSNSRWIRWSCDFKI